MDEQGWVSISEIANFRRVCVDAICYFILLGRYINAVFDACAMCISQVHFTK